MDIDTYLSKAWLLGFTNSDGSQISGNVVWGIVEKDNKGRWVPGDYCCTSVVQNVTGNTIQTENSTYQSIKEIIRETLPIQALPLLRKGHSPKESMFLLSLL